jgi:DNA polymerase III sliding clamp (beta) subunit (PCNA family)
MVQCLGKADSFCVDMDRLNTTLGCMSCDAIELTVEPQRIVIEGDSRVVLNTLPVEEFPMMPTDIATAIQVPAKDVSDLLQAVAFAEGDDMSRPELFDVLLRVKDGTMDAVCTNGRMIANARKTTTTGLDFSVSFPAKYVSSIAPVLMMPDANLWDSKNHIIAKTDSATCWVKKSLHAFPAAWDVLIAKSDGRKSIDIPTIIVEQACQSATSLGRIEDVSQVVLHWGRDMITVSVPGQHGDWKSSSEAESEGPGFDCPLNVEYIGKAIRKFAGTVQFTPTEQMSYFSGGDLKVAIGHMRRLK